MATGLERLVQLYEKGFPKSIPDDEMRIFLREFIKAVTELFDGTTVFATATLAADLNAGDTVTLGGKLYDATFVRPTFKLSSGTTIGGIKSGTTYYIIAWNACEVSQ
jgi:hypothetical protein